MPPSAASAWTRIGASVLMIATALGSGFVAASPAQAAAPMSVNCSTLVGSVSTDDSFNAAIDKVNLGLCNIITITNSIYLATQKTIDADRVTSLTITGNPDDSTLTSAPGLGIAISTSEDTSLTLTVSNLTFSGFDDSFLTSAALTAESQAGLTAVFTNTSFINNFAGFAPGGVHFSAGDNAHITINGNSRFHGNRSRYASGGALGLSGGTGSIITLGSPGDDSISFVSNTSMTQNGGAIAITAPGTNHQLTTHGVTFTDDSASGIGGAIFTFGSATFNNTDFTSNTASAGAGGAVRANGSVVVNGGTFHGNRAAQTGGAVSVGDDTATSQIANALFTNNSAISHGGAIHTQGLITVTGSIFRDDSAGGWGGAIAADDTITITSSLFQDDTAGQAGGAIISVYASVFSQGSTYRTNRARDDGGAISAPRRVTSTDDTFIGNQVSLYDGGAIEAGRVTTTGSRFTSNRTQAHGGAIAAASLDDSGSDFVGNRSLGRGGGVYLDDTQTASTFTVSTFRDDSAVIGGAIYANGPLTVTNSVFEDDTAANQGGAIFAKDTLSVTASIFRHNIGFLSAGAVWVEDTSTIVNSLFHSNEARAPDPGSGGRGGAIFSAGHGVSTTITGTTFTANRATQAGGGVSASGTVSLTDDTFTNNVAMGTAAGDSGGGAVHMSGPSATVTRSVFTNNDSAGGGGAIYAAATTAINSSTFELNRTTTAGTNGGAISASGDVSIMSSTFTSNRSTQAGGAVYLDAIAPLTASATVTDSRFHANTTTSSGGALSVDDTATISRSTFTDDTSGSSGGAIAARDLIMHSSSLRGNRTVYDGGAIFIRRSGIINNSTLVGNEALWGGAVSLDVLGTLLRINYSTLVDNTSSYNQGSALKAVAPAPIFLTGSVLAGASPLCYDDTSGPTYLNLTSTSSYSFATDTSCSGDGARTADDSLNTLYTTDDSLGVASDITNDDTPGWQVVIPDDTAVVNAYVPLSVLPSITTDQLNGLRNSPNGLTSAGAVQVRPMSITGPASATVAPGANATFSVTGYPGIGPTITYQWQRSTDGTSWTNVPGAQTTTLTLSSVTAADSGLQVRVLAVDGYGNDDTSAVATLTVTNPTPGTPPSAPRDPAASAGDARATVTWSAPSTSGSFPVSSYEVRNDRDGAVCLVTVTSGTPLECTLAGLTNGVAYRFSVRALNGAGWGPWSAWSNAVTPGGIAPTITITGSRHQDTVKVAGTTTGLAGKQVRAMVRLAGQTAFSPGSTPAVNDNGRFTWQRSTGKKIYVYFTHGDVTSNRVTIPARRR